MAINKIKVKNFKSFKDLDIELGNFNILIGANASGKTNFIKIFEFLRDIVKSGLYNAISMQGGIEYLKNLNIGDSENISLSVFSNLVYRFLTDVKIKNDKIGLEIFKTNYEFSLRSKKYEFNIVEDKILQKCEYLRVEEYENKFNIKEKLGKGEIYYSFIEGSKLTSFDKPKDLLIQISDIIPTYSIEDNLHLNKLLIESPFFYMPIVAMDFKDISLYDFDPKLPKNATPITGKAELEENGSNLSIVLKNIITDKDKKRKFANLVKELLPFVSDLGVAKFTDKSLLLKFREIYTKNQDIPASMISDGTINITALIIALYFEEKPITIIEEPERNIHPYLISKVMAMMKDASQNKQIIVTTHNPEMIKHADLEDILLVSRDKEGFTNITRPVEKEEVKIFLENDMGIEDLYVQNLLEI